MYVYKVEKKKFLGCKITTNLFCKPTDGHQYLHYDSCHAEPIKRSIVFSQTFRVKSISSEKK